jgi:hypothetical protein
MNLVSARTKSTRQYDADLVPSLGIKTPAMVAKSSPGSPHRFQTREKLVSLDQHFNLYVFPRGWDDDLLSALAKLVFYRAMLHAPVIAI